ncbi:MAG: DUF6259 domain-containing protein [Candidatus Sumerlaeota bacterium]|nr:DUF6259 domain-containing protein [Candidatus Sumerlaeota bacterium]
MAPLLSRTFGLLNGLLALEAAAWGAAASGPLYCPPAKEPPASPKLTFAASPEWIQRTPALYIPMPRSAGAGMLAFARPDLPSLPEMIPSFRDLPKLLDQARALGTDTIYLVDYYEGWPGQLPRNFWLNKGDYLPRSDLGGAEALREGLRAVHERGGRAIAYVEAFIISKRSAVGQAHGEQWSILTPQGPLAEPYPGNWHLCSACPEWVDYIGEVCRRLVGDYGFDGVHLDSYGAQRDWRCVNTAHGHAPGRPDVFNQGCVELVRRVRETIRRENPETIVLCELPAMPALFPYLDGSQDWGIHTLSQRPIWNAAGKTDVFTTGWSLDDLHQILALGHKLSLGAFWLVAPSGPSCLAALPAKRPSARNETGRRRFIEECLQTLHQWRNAGALLGLPMPEVEDVSPREMQGAGFFRSEESAEALFQRIRQRAEAIDEALRARGAAPLPSPAEHLRALLGARRALSAIIDRSGSVRTLQCGGSIAAYEFDSPAGQALSVVNVGNESADVNLSLSSPASNEAWRDALTGERFPMKGDSLRLPAPGHSLRFLVPQ